MTDVGIDAADVDWKATAERMQGDIDRLLGVVVAAHGLICNAHQKRIDDVTNADGASSGWAEAARRWVDAYPPMAASEPAGGVR